MRHLSQIPIFPTFQLRNIPFPPRIHLVYRDECTGQDDFVNFGKFRNLSLVLLILVSAVSFSSMYAVAVQLFNQYSWFNMTIFFWLPVNSIWDRFKTYSGIGITVTFLIIRTLAVHVSLRNCHWEIRCIMNIFVKFRISSPISLYFKIAT